MNDDSTAASATTPTEATLSDSLVEQANSIAATDPDQALALAQKATEADPASSGVWYARGILARDLNHPEEALGFLQKAAELEPDSSVAWLSLAELHAALGQHPEAADAYRRVTGLDHANREAWLGLANALASQDQAKPAADVLNEAAKAAPELASDPEIALPLASYHIQFGEFHEAAACLDALDAAPMNESQKAIALFWRGRALQGLDDNQGAINAFEKAQPDLPPQLKGPAFYFEAVSLNELPDVSRALQAIVQAEPSATDGPSRGFMLLEKGKALLGAGQPKLAIEALREATTLMPPGVAQSNCWMQIGVAHNNLGELADAVEALDRSIAAAPAGREAAHIRIIASFNKAIAEYQRQNPQQALDALEKALTDLGENPGVLPGAFKATLLISRANMQATFKSFDDARASLDEAEAANPALGTDVQFWVIKMNASFFAGRKEEALASPPGGIANHPLVLATRGTIQNATGDFNGGQAQLRRAAACAPDCGDDPLAWAGAGLAELAMYHWQPAVDALTKARGLSPQLAADVSLGYGLGVALIALERYQDAWEVLQNLPDTNDTLQAKASALQGLGRSPDALQAMGRVSVPDAASPLPTILSYWLWRGSLLLMLDRATDALPAFDTALDLAKQPVGAPLRAAAAVGRASALIKLDKRNDALEFLTAFTAEVPAPDPPRPGAAWWLLSGLLAEKNRFEEALRAINMAQALEPGNGDILLSKGKALLNLEDYRQAETVFQQAVALARKDHDRFEALIGTGNAENRLDLYEAAIETFRGALSVASGDDRNDSRLWVGLGAAYRSLGRLQAALRTFQEGWRLDPSRPKSADLALGVAAVFLDQNRDREAADFLIAAKPQTPNDPRIDVSLGIALYRCKQSTAAQQAWQRAKAGGSQQAADYLESIPKPAPDPGDLMGYWFGAAAPAWRRVAGAFLGLFILTVALLPVISKDAIPWLRWLNTGDNYKMGWITLVAFLLVFLAPVLKSISFDVGPLKLEAAKPEVTAKPNVDALLEKLQTGGGLAVAPQSASGTGVGSGSSAASAVMITASTYRI